MTLAKDVKIQSYEAGHVVWFKGSDISSWQFIVTGLVSVGVPSANAAAIPIDIYGRHTWFGEQAIINRMPSYAEYVCLVPTEVLTLDKTKVLDLIKSEPGFSRQLVGLISWRAQRVSEMLVLMKCGNPCVRVVMGLSQFAEALAYSGDRPPTIGFDDGIQIPVTQTVLASLCGVSRTVFSEFIHQLAGIGLLRISYGKIEILSTSRWHEFAREQRATKFENLNTTFADIQARFETFV